MLLELSRIRPLQRVQPKARPDEIGGTFNLLLWNYVVDGDSLFHRDVDKLRNAKKFSCKVLKVTTSAT